MSFFSVCKHEGYTDMSLNNNLAIIRLKESVKLDNSAQLACIPTSRDSSVLESKFLVYNTSVVSIGWAYYKVNTDFDFYLTDFQQNIIQNSNCTDFYSNNTIQRQNICAGMTVN